jgi:hypothetical protein
MPKRTTTPTQGSRVDKLMRSLEEETSPSRRGRLANDLLDEFSKGHPLDALRALLGSEKKEVSRVGVWVASELGVGARPLITEVARHLESDDDYARFFAIDAMLTCASEGDGAILGKVMLMLTDAAKSVRWKATHFAARASHRQLELALTELLKWGDIDPAYEKGVEAIVNNVRDSDLESARGLLSSDSPILRRCGLAIAFRMSRLDATALRVAAESNDNEIRDDACEELKNPTFR